MIERVTVVHGDRGQEVDGIRDHGAQLVAALEELALPAAELRLDTSAETASGRGPAGHLRRALRRAGPNEALLLQYSPFCYGRRGLAPWLPACLLEARAMGPRRPALALMMHEPYVPMTSAREALMGSWQRLQLSALQLAADVVYASIEPWAHELSAAPPWRLVHHLPVGSNLPDGRAQRGAQRARLGAGPDTLVVACVGRDHPGWLAGHVVAAANALAASGRPALLLELGAQAPALAGLDPAVALQAPGYLEPTGLAAHLAAADLFLAPMADGVSTRRSSLMAALQHELPVLGTAGPLTDPGLMEAGSALALTDIEDRDAFAKAAPALAADPARRAAAGAAARQLYEREFRWEAIARKLKETLPAQ
jgi:glycosyltransferase involved in cell wall biosynthesis